MPPPSLRLYSECRVLNLFCQLLVRLCSNVREVHRLALAADHCQLTTIKAAVAEFCSRSWVAPVSVCHAPLGDSLKDMQAALYDLEAFHQVRTWGLLQTAL